MKKLLQKSLVLLTVITMLFSSVPFAFADDNEPAKNEDLSTDLLVEEEDFDVDTDSDTDIEVTLPEEENTGITETDNEELENNDNNDNNDNNQEESPIDSDNPEETGEPGSEHVHTAGDWIVEQASFESDGSRKKLCIECGEVIAEEPIYMVSDVSFDADPAAYLFKDEIITPELTVKDSQGNPLTQDVDYTIQFSDNDRVGKAVATITLQGENYSGTKDFPFVILSDKLKRTNVLVGDTKKAAIDDSVTEVLGNDITFSTADESIATVDTEGFVEGVSAGKTTLYAKVGNVTFSGDVNVLQKQTGSVVESEEDEFFNFTFTYDGKSQYKVILDGARVYYSYFDWYDTIDYVRDSISCKACVFLWCEDDLLAEKTYSDGYGSFRIDPSILKEGVEYSVSGWTEYKIPESYYEDYDEFEVEESTVTASLYRTPAPEAIAFDETSYEMLVSKTQDIAYTSDGGATKLIKWASSDPSVATVSKGTVTAKAPGECTITATLPNGFTDQCKIKVSKYEELSFKSKSKTLYGITSVKLTLTNQSSIYDKITWESSNTKLATIDSTGKLTTKKAGTVTITASVVALAGMYHRLCR